jgi:hypothetical protein
MIKAIIFDMDGKKVENGAYRLLCSGPDIIKLAFCQS